MKQYVQYGCGLSAPDSWINFDASPTLRLQRLPVVGSLFKRKVNFPPNVKYGDILLGLPEIQANSCDGVYCSHVLEHLSLNDFRLALRNTYSILKDGGIFRCVLPDLFAATEEYIKAKQRGDCEASVFFMRSTMLGIVHRPQGIKQRLIANFGNSHHLWMWDKESLITELTKTGFKSVRSCKFHDSIDEHFKAVEDEDRFYGAVAIEAIK